MSAASPRLSPLARAMVVLGVAVVVMGALLFFFGAGAELSVPHDVTFVVRVDHLDKVVAAQIRPGDPLYTDFAGMYIGRVKSVVVQPAPRAVPDSQGALHKDPDPVQVRADVTIEGVGREGKNIVALTNQVIQAGMQFSVISDRYFVRGQVVTVDVR